MASEVTSDHNSEIIGLNNPCSSAFLAPKCFFQPFKRKEEGRRQNRLVDLRARSSPQIKRPPPPRMSRSFVLSGQNGSSCNDGPGGPQFLIDRAMYSAIRDRKPLLHLTGSSVADGGQQESQGHSFPGGMDCRSNTKTIRLARARACCSRCW